MAGTQRRAAADPGGGLKPAVRRAAVQIVLLLLASGLGGVSTPVAAGPGAESGPAGAGEPVTVAVEELIVRLGHPDWAVREDTRRRLLDMAGLKVETLGALHRRPVDHESRLALRQIIEHLYYRAWMASGAGFLGFAPLIEDGLPDPQTGREVVGVVVREVLPGQPAERQGLRSGDMLVSLDGRSIREVLAGAAASAPSGGLRPGRERPAEERIRLFTAEIKRRPPGSRVRVRRLRVEDPARVIALPGEVEVDRSLAGCQLQVVRIAAPPAWGGQIAPGTPLAVTAVTAVEEGSAARRAGLRIGDLILGPAGQAPGSVAGPEALEQARASAGQVFAIEVVSLKDEELILEIGGRPVDMLNPEDLAEAQASFAAWWRENSGEASLRPAGRGGTLDLAWRSRSGGAAYRGGRVLP